MPKKPDLLPGTLDLLILNTLARAPLHGYGIAQAIKRLSDDVLTVEESYSAGEYARAARECITEISGRGRLAWSFRATSMRAPGRAAVKAA